MVLAVFTTLFFYSLALSSATLHKAGGTLPYPNEKTRLPTHRTSRLFFAHHLRSDITHTPTRQGGRPGKWGSTEWRDGELWDAAILGGEKRKAGGRKKQSEVKKKNTKGRGEGSRGEESGVGWEEVGREGLGVSTVPEMAILAVFSSRLNSHRREFDINSIWMAPPKSITQSARYEVKIQMTGPVLDSILSIGNIQ